MMRFSNAGLSGQGTIRRLPFATRTCALLACGLLTEVAALHRYCRGETAFEIEQQALDQRERITSGHMTLVARMLKVKGNVRTETTTEREFHFDSGRLRCVTSVQHSSEDDTIRVSCFGCDPRGHIAWISGSVIDSDEPQVIVTPPGLEVNMSFDIPPPAELGMIPFQHTMARHFPMDAYLTRADRDEPSVEQTELDGLPCFRISYSTLNDSEVVEWISSDRGYSVIGLDEQFRNRAGAEFHDSMRATVEIHEPCGIWFPVAIVYERTINGSLFTREEIDISVLSFNSGVDDDVFSLAGIEQLSPGTRVVIRRTQGEPLGNKMEWDGRQIVESEKTWSPPRPSSNLRVLQWVNLAILLTCVSILCIRRYFRLRPTDDGT